MVGRLGAQSRTVEITGIVTDKQGSVISGATVDVTNEATGVKLNTRTNEAGVYRIQYLTSGTYIIEGSMQGFQRIVHSGFLLQTGQVGRLDLVLEIGEMTQKVEVTAAAPLMQTESSEVSRSVVSREMQYQPNLNRDFNTLLSRNARVMLSHELDRELHPQFRVRELDLFRGFADFHHFASGGEEIALLVVGRVDLGRLLEPDVVRGVETVRGGGGVRRCQREDRHEGCCTCFHVGLLLFEFTSRLRFNPP